MAEKNVGICVTTHPHTRTRTQLQTSACVRRNDRQSIRIPKLYNTETSSAKIKNKLREGHSIFAFFALKLPLIKLVRKFAK